MSNQNKDLNTQQSAVSSHNRYRLQTLTLSIRLLSGDTTLTTLNTYCVPTPQRWKKIQ